jgi:hypothetical protein
VEDLEQIAQRDRRGERAGCARKNQANAQNKKRPAGLASFILFSVPLKRVLFLVYIINRRQVLIEKGTFPQVCTHVYKIVRRM